MLILGLTGSIATGKSTVSTILSRPPFSLPVIDADIIARRIIEPGTPGYDKVVSHFSSTTPDLFLPLPLPESASHTRHFGAPLNRAALGRRVFGESEEKKKDRAVLNQIVHPAVRREILKEAFAAYLRGNWAVVLDVPLLFESGLDVWCGTVIVVGIHSPDLQMRRLMRRDSHLSEAEAADRVHSQGDVRKKAERCLARGESRGVMIWNDNGEEELRLELEKVISKVKKTSPEWWAWLLLLCPPLAGLVGLWNFTRATISNRRWRRHELQSKVKLR